jgi:hypothetical protein
LQIWYISYIINLVVQAFLFTNIINLDKLELYNLEDKDRELTDKEVKKARFRLLRLLGKEYNIVVYICRSSTCTEYFRILAGKIIPIDNCTR